MIVAATDDVVGVIGLAVALIGAVVAVVSAVALARRASGGGERDESPRLSVDLADVGTPSADQMALEARVHLLLERREELHQFLEEALPGDAGALHALRLLRTTEYELEKTRRLAHKVSDEQREASPSPRRADVGEA